MYPITCYAGYALPIKAGRFKICGISAAVNSTAAASRITIVDNGSNTIVAENQALKTVLADLKGLANTDGVLTEMFAEPIQVRNGVTVTDGSGNTLAGRNFVYIK
jgi:hypothetical protein